MSVRTYDMSLPAEYGAAAERAARVRARADNPKAARVDVSWRGGRAGVHTVRVKVTTNDVPGWYAPWTGPAHAYPVAESVQAARQGMRRVRKSTMFHLVITSADAVQACAACGRPCSDPSPDRTAPDTYVTGYYEPRTKAVRLMHYTCSWGATLAAVEEWGARMR